MPDMALSNAKLIGPLIARRTAAALDGTAFAVVALRDRAAGRGRPEQPKALLSRLADRSAMASLAVTVAIAGGKPIRGRLPA